MSLLLPLLLGQAIVRGPAQNAPTTGGINVSYDRRKEITFTGSVTGKTKGSTPGKSQGMSLLVRTGKTVREVEVGPAWFVSRQDASVKMGDKITVTGMPVVIDRRQRVVIARQIKRGKNVLALRDAQGTPYWSASRGQMAMNPSDMGTAYSGTIGNMTTFDIDGVPFAGYVVQTPNGPMNVAVAPMWYWQNQPTTFSVGNNVTFYGSNPIRSNNVILADSATYGGGTFVFSRGGIPVYGGFRPGR